jgi:ABC-type glycerol-3-phosphate transport system substrate-binding protein
MYEAYAASHPNVDLKIVPIAGPDLLQKVELAIESGSQVPDVAFPGSNADDSTMLRIYAANLAHAVPKRVQSQFAFNSLKECTVNGQLLCLRNDVAPVVLWFNGPLFAKYGYKVPQTWQQYVALGLRAAKEHPGTLVGTFGEADTEAIWFASFQCPTNQLVGPKTVLINMSAPGCKRMESVVDPLLKAGALSPAGELSATYAKLVEAGNLLMEPGPAWMGDFLLNGTWHLPNDQWAASQPLRWSKEPIVTGFLGGGAWMAYKKSPNLKAAESMLQWLATNPAAQTSAPTYPAYVPAAKAWAAKRATDPFYAKRPGPALAKAAATMATTYNWVTYNVYDAYSRTIGPAIQNGNSLASAMSAFQSALVALAKSAGYKVTTS